MKNMAHDAEWEDVISDVQVTDSVQPWEDMALDISK